MNPRSRAWRSIVPALLVLLLVPATVWAHAELVESDPPDGGVIAGAPYTMTATFSEPLTGNSRIVVRDAAGEEVARGEISAADPQTLVVDLPALPPAGYVARWTAVGADGHVERGEINFSVAAATSSPTATPSPTALPTPRPTGGSSPPLPSPTTAAPTVTPSPPPGSDGGSTVAAGDVLLALGLAALLASALAFLLWRRRA